VQVEKMLDAVKASDKTSAAEPDNKPDKEASSSALAFPDNLASATAGDAGAASSRKN